LRSPSSCLRPKAAGRRKHERERESGACIHGPSGPSLAQLLRDSLRSWAAGEKPRGPGSGARYCLAACSGAQDPSDRARACSVAGRMAQHHRSRPPAKWARGGRGPGRMGELARATTGPQHPQKRGSRPPDWALFRFRQGIGPKRAANLGEGEGGVVPKG